MSDKPRRPFNRPVTTSDVAMSGSILVGIVVAWCLGGDEYVGKWFIALGLAWALLLPFALLLHRKKRS
jgi:hypothetical protein